MTRGSVFRNNPRAPWLLAYLAINISAGFIINDTRELIGEVNGLQVADFGIVPWALMFLLVSYLAIMVVGFRLAMSLRLRAIGAAYDNGRVGRGVGLLLILLQVGFISFFLSTGTFVAGSTMRSDSVWSQVWVLLSTDMLFLIYYGTYRDSGWFLPNLVLALLSNVLRGWSGIFIIVIFFEFCRLIRRNKLRLWHVSFSVGAVVLMYPLLLLVKLQVRSQFGGGASIAEFYSIADSVISGMSMEQFGEISLSSLTQIVGRLQLLSDVIAVFQFSDELRHMVEHGLVVPFWWEGLHGLAFDRLFTSERTMNIGVAFASLIDPYSEVGSWNANVSYVGWFFIMPAYAPVYLIYTAVLALASVMMLRRISARPLAEDMLWYAWLVFLIPGWLAAFIVFVHSLVVFMCMQRIVSLWQRSRIVISPSGSGGEWTHAS